jgi:hypothetical protein
MPVSVLLALLVVLDDVFSSRPFSFTGFVGAVQPITISASCISYLMTCLRLTHIYHKILVPGSQSTVITTPISVTTTANVKEGTSLVFSVADAVEE